MRAEPTPAHAPLTTTRQLLTHIVEQYVDALQLALEQQLAQQSHTAPSFSHLQEQLPRGEGGERRQEVELQEDIGSQRLKMRETHTRAGKVRVNNGQNLTSQHSFVKETSFDEEIRQQKHTKNTTHPPQRPPNLPQPTNHHHKPPPYSPNSPLPHPQPSKTSLCDLKPSPLSPHPSNLGYNQYQDKTLVQYFYTKKHHLFPQDHKMSTCSHHKEENNKLHPTDPLKNNFISTRNPKKYDFQKLIRTAEGKSFEVKAETGRRAQFNSYDLISCQKSIRRGATRLPSDTQQSSIREARCTPSELLKSRMVRLQSKIYSKVPCLVEMGVKFRRVKRKR